MSNLNPYENSSKRLTIYFSADAWAGLMCLMGVDGKPSPTVNSLILEAHKRHLAQINGNNKPIDE